MKVQFTHATLKNVVFGGCSTVATSVGRNGVLLDMQRQTRNPYLLIDIDTTIPWSLGRLECNLVPLLWIAFSGCLYELQREDWYRLPRSQRCFWTTRAWRLRIYHWTQAVMFGRCTIHHCLGHTSVDESHFTKTSCCLERKVFTWVLRQLFL